MPAGSGGHLFFHLPTLRGYTSLHKTSIDHTKSVYKLNRLICFLFAQ